MTTEPRPEKEIFNEQYYFKLWEDALFSFFTEGSDVPLFEALNQIDKKILDKYLMTKRIYRLADKIIKEWKIQGCSRENVKQLIDVRYKDYQEKLVRNDIDITIFRLVCHVLQKEMTEE